MRSLARALAAAALPLAFTACDWFTDFKRYQVSYRPFPATIDSIAALATNPTPVSRASLENGRKQYSINCAVCHGDTGAGNGPVVQYGMAGISLVNDRVRGLADGYIYGMIRNGRGSMPSYNRIEELDRWDVVNYLRALQGTVPNEVGVGPTGVPGQTGAALPAASATAPTRPAPFFNPRQAAAPGAEPPSRAPQAATDSATQAPAARTDTQALNQTKRPTP
jgi:mono/diheme cytochrome c family protein